MTFPIQLRFNLKTLIILITYTCVGLSLFQVYNSCKKNADQLEWKLDKDWTLIWSKSGWYAYSVLYYPGENRISTPIPEFPHLAFDTWDIRSVLIEKTTVHLPFFDTTLEWTSGVLVDPDP